MFRACPYIPNDRAFVLGLAPRLAIGMQPWRDVKLWLTTVEGWLGESIDQHTQKTMVLIAENEQGERLGFATVSHSTHFTGQRQAYIGELATSETADSQFIFSPPGGKVGHAFGAGHFNSCSWFQCDRRAARVMRDVRRRTQGFTPRTERWPVASGA